MAMKNWYTCSVHIKYRGTKRASTTIFESRKGPPKNSALIAAPIHSVPFNLAGCYPTTGLPVLKEPTKIKLSTTPGIKNKMSKKEQLAVELGTTTSQVILILFYIYLMTNYWFFLEKKNLRKKITAQHLVFQWDGSNISRKGVSRVQRYRSGPLFNCLLMRLQLSSNPSHPT